MPSWKINFCGKFAIKTHRAPVANADIGNCKSSIHYLIFIWTARWWNLNKIVWSKIYTALSFLEKSKIIIRKQVFKTVFDKMLMPFWKTFLQLKQFWMLNYYFEGNHLSAFQKLQQSDKRNQVKGCTKHSRPDYY